MSRIQVTRSSDEGEEEGVTVTIEISLFGLTDEEVGAFDIDGLTTEKQVMDGTLGIIARRLALFLRASSLMGPGGFNNAIDLLNRKLLETGEELSFAIDVSRDVQDRPSG